MRLRHVAAILALPLFTACNGLMPTQPAELSMSWTTDPADIPDDHHPITIAGVVPEATGFGSKDQQQTSLLGDLQPGRYDICVAAVDAQGKAGPCELIQRVSFP